jgi:hypothetical protein
MRYLITILILCLAVWLVCGCSPISLHQTWPDGSRTDLWACPVLTDKRINAAAFARLPDGTVVIVIEGYDSRTQGVAVISTGIGAVVKLLPLLLAL